MASNDRLPSPPEFHPNFSSDTKQAGDASALNQSAMQRLAMGDAAAAAALLSRAVAIEGNVGELWFNLAFALRASNQLSEALVAIERCVALNPFNVLAALEKGTLQEDLGCNREAVITYRGALAMLPPGTPPRGLEAAVDRARHAIAAANRELEGLVSRRLATLRARHDSMALARFDRCVDIMLQKRPVSYQQPTFMFFPELPAIEFYPREMFPELHSLEAATADIRNELLDVMSDERAEIVPYLTGPGGAPARDDDLTNSLRWSAYYFWNNGERMDAHIERCPRTFEALQRWRLWDVPGNGPSAMFSILQPHTRIPTHTGTVNTRLVVHLPLVVPPRCGFRVGGESREWTPGEAFVFDDSINHEAWNDSDAARAVLIFTIWSPYLSDAEHELVRELTDAIGDFYGVGEFYRRRAASQAPDA